MLAAILVLQAVILLVVAFLFLRKTAAGTEPADPRLTQLLAADLPGAMARGDARGEALERHLRDELAGLRTDSAAEATRSRTEAETASSALRTEILGNVHTLSETLTQRFTAFTADTTRHYAESREQLHARLQSLGAAQGEHQEKLRGAVEARLDKLNENNAAKLDEMRQTVDEKLQKTLHSRLTESFGAVTDQLTKVHAGLGEMNSLTTGVNDLNRIFSNVKSRGGFAEVQLGNLLEQVLAPGQFVKNARVKKGSQESVEFAVQFPGADGEQVLLPIDAKFPREDWERLETAYEGGSGEELDRARKAFDAAIRTEGKRICSKYINEPVTTPYAIMFLPTEGLYAEVLRRDGLQSDLHQNCKVMVAGPSNLYALLTSFQLGFRMLNLQNKGNEVWKVLGETKTEFGKFGVLMEKMETKLGETQNVIHDLNVRTRSINRKLRDVSTEEAALPSGTQVAFDGLLPMLSAREEAE